MNRHNFPLDLLPDLTSGLPSLEFERRLSYLIHSTGWVASSDVSRSLKLRRQSFCHRRWHSSDHCSAAFTVLSTPFPLIARACWSTLTCLHWFSSSHCPPFFHLSCFLKDVGNLRMVILMQLTVAFLEELRSNPPCCPLPKMTLLSLLVCLSNICFLKHSCRCHVLKILLCSIFLQSHSSLPLLDLRKVLPASIDAGRCLLRLMDVRFSLRLRSCT